MEIDHGCAIALDAIVSRVWGLTDFSHLYHRIDADWFKSNPFDAAILILAPYVLHDSNVDYDSFVCSTLRSINTLCNMDEYSTEAETEIFQKIKELSTYLAEHYTPAK